MDIEKMLNGLSGIEKGPDDIYYAKIKSDISYPDDGNELCFQIENDSFWFQHRNNVIYELVRKFNANKTFFDIGGGNGFVSKRLEDEGIPTVLIEPGISGAVNAKKNGLKHVVCATLENSGLNENSLPSAGLFDVAEHIEDDADFLQKINDLLVQGGPLYLTVPSYNFLWSFDDEEAGHFRRHTINSMTKLLHRTGFEVLYSSYFFSVLPLPIFLLRTIPSVVKLNRSSSKIMSNESEHKKRNGITEGFLGKIWNWELSRIKQVKRVFFGSSCLFVAQKK